MKKIIQFINYFTRFEIFLWSISVLMIFISFLIFNREGFLTLAASLLGVTALIFNAKGNPLGQILMIIFSLLYGIISFTFSYYGEMITYLGMTAPMAVFSLVSWLKNPYNGNKSEVKINQLRLAEIIFIFGITLVITIVFYFILKYFKTSYLLISSVSVATSFLAVCLTYKRSEFFTLAYALNDVILVVLWIMASLTDISYISVTICFAVFFINDIYGFASWSKIKERQSKNFLS